MIAAAIDHGVPMQQREETCHRAEGLENPWNNCTTLITVLPGVAPSTPPLTGGGA